MKYQTSRSYSDLSFRALRVHLSHIRHTINTAFHHHQLSFLDLSLPNVKVSELRGKEEGHWKSITLIDPRLLPDPPKQNWVISVWTPTLNSQVAVYFLKQGHQSSNLNLQMESSKNFLILSNTDLELHGDYDRSRPVIRLLNSSIRGQVLHSPPALPFWEKPTSQPGTAKDCWF